MTLIVAPQSQVERVLAAHAPSHVLSLVSPDAEPPGCVGRHHHILKFNDIAAPLPGLVAPSKALVEGIIAFGSAWEQKAPLLIHCYAGISRSTAAAYILACHFSEAGEEEAIARTLRLASPMATPNALMVAIADELLGRNGAMIKAVAALGRGTEASEGCVFELQIK